MPIIYRVNVDSAGKENLFRITWHNMQTEETDQFEISPGETFAGDVLNFYRGSRHQLDIGQKLFRFLDGSARHLQLALDDAHRAGELLQLHLFACRQVTDWPFELLAREGSFLLTERLHLVRRVSDWGAAKEILPGNRQLKMLLMACSALDIKPELDFEREEEVIFRVTEKLAIDMDVEDSGSLEGLKEKLKHEKYDVVHLSGHAYIDENGGPYFIMEDETGHKIDVSPDKLWNEALIENPPRLLFISGCHTAGATDNSNSPAVSFVHRLTQKMQKHDVQAVLGWGHSVGEEQAIYAEELFYYELSRGKPILDAVKRARYELAAKYKANPYPAWPLLRLFSNGLPLNALVTEEQLRKPKPKAITYVYLKQGRVRVMQEGFIGRRRQLQQSLYALNQDAGKVGLLLLGTGGLGKSCLAGKICERFKDHHLIVIPGKLDTITLNEALTDAFILSGDEKGSQILAQKMTMTDKLPRLCAACFKEKKYLLILDDFDQNLEGADQGQLGPLLPEAAELLKVLLHYLPFSGKMTQLVITCRYEFSLTEKGRDVIEEKLQKIWLSSFRETEKFKKVRELKNILNYENPSAAHDLLAAGHGNPLLMEWIDQLVGQMKDMEVSRLADAIKGKQQDFIQEHVIRELRQRGGQELESLLHWLSIYRLPVGEEGVQRMAEQAGLTEWKESLKKGMALTLIEHDQARQTYQLIPILRDELLKKLEDISSCHHIAFQYYKKICEANEFFDPIPVEEWIYHALGCGYEEIASEQGGHLVKYLREIQALWESRRIGLWLLQNKKNALSNEYDAFLLNETGTTLKSLGEFKKAAHYFDRAFAIHRAIYGEYHHALVMDLSNLGATWEVLASPDKAIEYYEKGLHISAGKDFAAQYPHIMGQLLNNLGTAWNRKGDYQKAIEYYQEALKTWKKFNDKDHSTLAVTLNNLGAAYNNSGKFREAADYFRQALALDREELGEVHPSIAEGLNNLGAVNFDLGDHKKAIAYYEEAITILWKYYEFPHVTIAVAMSNLAKVYLDTKQLDNAKKYYERAYRIFADILGPENDYAKVIYDQINAVELILNSKQGNSDKKFRDV